MISELFTKAASHYLTMRKTSFAGNLDADIIRHQIPDALKISASISDSYKVYGSVGQGQWSEIPWVAVLDKDITEGTRTGYYVVYLFSADMKHIYLSLGIGWEQFAEAYGVREGRAIIEKTGKQLQSILRSPLKDFSFAKRDLKATTILGKGYESAVICHKVYATYNMPPDDVIVNDLRNIIGVYRELKGYIGKDILNLELPEEEVAEEEFTRKVIEESEKTTTPEEAKDKIKNLSKLIERAPAQERTKMAKYISRNRKFAELVKQAANYTCQICGKPPFKTRSGGMYAEAHHTLELAYHRIDHPDIMICVCAQCHRILTYGSDEAVEEIRKPQI